MDENGAPTPDDHARAVSLALPLVALAEREDADAFAIALAESVSTAEDAGLVIYGLVELTRFALGQSAVPRAERLPILEGLAADLAVDLAGGAG